MSLPYVSRRFYFDSFLAAELLGGALLFGTVITTKGRLGEEVLLPFILGECLLIYGFGVFLALQYKMWKALPPQAARTTPARAVGLMFIPAFNLYWMFQVIWGWARDLNRFVRERNLRVPPVSERVTLAACAFALLGNIVGYAAILGGAPGAGLPFTVPCTVLTMLLMLIFVHQTCTSLNTLPATVIQEASAAADSALGPAARSQKLGIASMVAGILSIVVPYLGLVFGLVAILLARAQGKRGRSGPAKAGKILGIVGAGLWGLALLCMLILLTSA